MHLYNEIWYQSSTGEINYARHYINSTASETIVCLHGLTRNSADFDTLATHLQARFSVLVPDQRGRGNSPWCKPELYNPTVYTQDMWCLLDQLELDKVALIGTSMGGLMAMIMAAEKPERITSIVLNDIGPEVKLSGLERIKKYIGHVQELDSWEQAISKTKATNADVYPNFTLQQWVDFTRNLYRETATEKVVLNYDPAISDAILSSDENAVPASLWPLFALLKPFPLLFIRGEYSDILAADCLHKMTDMHSHAHWIEILGCGHAPTLNELQAVYAIDQFLGLN